MALLSYSWVNCVSDSPDVAFRKVVNSPNGWGYGCAVAGVLFHSQRCRQERSAGVSSPCSSEQEHGDTCPRGQTPTKSHSKAWKRAIIIENELYGLSWPLDSPPDYASSTCGLSPGQSFPQPRGVRAVASCCRSQLCPVCAVSGKGLAAWGWVRP